MSITTNPVTRFLLVFAMAIAVFPLERAFSQDEAPAIDPPEYWRVMGQDDEHSTSRCIGKPDTPLCTMETFLAGIVRESNDLCKIALGPFKCPILLHGPPQLAWSLNYRVAGVKRITRDHQPHGFLGRGPPPALKGDLMIIIQENNCYNIPEDDHYKRKCDSVLAYPHEYYRYLMRKDGGVWHIVTGSWVVDRW